MGRTTEHQGKGKGAKSQDGGGGNLEIFSFFRDLKKSLLSQHHGVSALVKGGSWK